MSTVVGTFPTLASASAAIQNVEDHLNTYFIGREAEARSALVGIIAKRNVIFLSPPGMAKSQMISEIAACLGKKYFYKPLSPTSEYDDLFGPLSISAIKQDKRIRQDQNYLPQAQIAFLDEVFRGSGSIRDALLRIMNEGTYDQDGMDTLSRVEVIFSASNEGPRGHHDDAFWSRFALKHKLREVADGEEFLRLLDLEAISLRPHLDFASLEVLRATAQQAVVPLDIRVLLNNLRKELRTKGIIPNERTWIWARGLLAAHAAFRGSAHVEEEDIAILAPVLWNQPEEIETVAHAVHRCVDAMGEATRGLLVQAKQILDHALNPTQGDNPVTIMQAAVEGSSKLKKIEEKLKEMLNQADAGSKARLTLHENLVLLASYRQSLFDRATQ